ncbi:hypothetical protein AWW67_02155 [Roseivirga seohaensis]|uniref:DNA-binding protein n=1 Tax=Roseivirga seohaensis TaxID=1914963 RepID=A0A150XYY3_9BACT|nr:hypothetical protein [Roseivirga seohaensis]KYG83943.1 hypothetical protein AWW67_02155 [Roseivirga seohaensis]
MKVISPGITKAELADMYGVSLRTFNGWLKDADIIENTGKKQKKLNPRQLYEMVKQLYLPVGVTISITEPDFLVREVDANNKKM